MSVMWQGSCLEDFMQCCKLCTLIACVVDRLTLERNEKQAGSLSCYPEYTNCDDQFVLAF